MRSGVGKRQDEDVVLNLVEQNPVVLDVAVSETCEVVDERMVFVLRRQHFSVGKHSHAFVIFLMSFPRLSIFLRLFL